MKKFVYNQKTLKKWLFEQEDVFDTGGEEAAADEGGDEAADEGGDEAADEGGEEAGGGGDTADAGGENDPDEAEEEEEEEIVVDPADEIKLSKSVDQDLEALLMDYEMQARKSKEIEANAEDETIQIEGLSLKFLTEQDQPPSYEEELDLDRFSSEVARLVKNYTSLLDMEKMLVNKAREFVVTRYGEEAEKMMLDILSTKHDIEVANPAEPPVTALDIPTAVGAGTGGAGGAA